jgi:hypothetical protein
MSHLNNNSQKQKHLGLSNVTLRRRSNVKSPQIMVISVCVLHQQSDDMCKVQHENTEWSEMRCHVLSFAKTLLFVLSVDCPHLDVSLDASDGGVMSLSELSFVAWSCASLLVRPPCLVTPTGGFRGCPVKSSSSSSVSSRSMSYSSESLCRIMSRSCLLFLLVDATCLSCVQVYLSLSANTKWMYSLVPIPHVVV